MITFKRSFVLLTIFIILSGCTEDENTNHYSHSDPGFTVDFPQGWELKTGLAGTAVMAVSPSTHPLDNYRESINIVIEDISDKPSADFYYQSNLKTMESFLKEFTLESQSDASINSHPAKKLIFRSTTGSVNSKFLMYMVAHNRLGYVITSTATPESYNEFSELFEKTAQSFRIVN